jgi:hypothetical protein
MEKTNKEKWGLIQMVIRRIIEINDTDHLDILFSKCWELSYDMGILPPEYLDADRVEKIP